MGSLVAIIAIVSGVVILSKKWHTAMQFPKSLRTVQVHVKDEVRIKATPQLPDSNGKLGIELEFETTQNQDFLDSDITQIAFIQFPDEKVIEPIKWKEVMKDSYSKKGTLYFKLPPKFPKKFDLVIYVLDPAKFHWPADDKTQ